MAYLKQFNPLTPREKFDEWAWGTYDPRGISVLAFELAMLEHSVSDGFCGYGKCFGSVELADRAHFRMYSLKECERLLRSAGFRIEIARKFKIGWLWGLMTFRGRVG